MGDEIEPGVPGQLFSEFLAEEGLLEDANAYAAKRVLVWQVAEAMGRAGLSRGDLAGRLGVDLAGVERLLDPADAGVSLGDLVRLAGAVGGELRVGLV